MSAVTERHTLAEAVELAEAFRELLTGCCDRLEVAGSVRRRQATVGDVELVVVPTIGTVYDLFAEPAGGIDLLDHRLDGLRSHGAVEPRRRADGRIVWGQRAKFLRWGGFPIDLFAVDADRFGWILALRTGPAAFSRQLVVPIGQQTKDGRPGLMPGFLLPRDGWLTYRTSAERIPTPEEDDVWRLFNFAAPDPWERT